MPATSPSRWLRASRLWCRERDSVTAHTPAVLIDGFYCNGIAAVITPVDGLPGGVYQLSVIVPDPAELAKNNPDLKNFRFPPQPAIQLVMGSGNSRMASQNGVF